VWGRSWLPRGEAFGALSSALARARRAAVRRDAGTRRTGTDTDARADPDADSNPDGGDGPTTDHDADADADAEPGGDAGLRTDAGPDAANEPGGGGGLAVLVAVWLGAVAFDLFSGTRAWVDLAGASSGWARTGRATGCLLVAMAVAWAVVAGSGRLAAGRHASAAGRRRVGRSVSLTWLVATAGAFLAHGVTLLLVDGQLALALGSDPLGRGWDLFGTATRTVDYSPLTPGLVGTAQLVAAVAGAVGGVAVVAGLEGSASGPAPRPTPGSTPRTTPRSAPGSSSDPAPGTTAGSAPETAPTTAARPEPGTAAGSSPGTTPDMRAALRALWVTAVGLAGVAAAVVATLAADLE
jgi:hypothetical protein